jgi:hypothetical protein
MIHWSGIYEWKNNAVLLIWTMYKVFLKSRGEANELNPALCTGGTSYENYATCLRMAYFDHSCHKKTVVYMLLAAIRERSKVEVLEFLHSWVRRE